MPKRTEITSALDDPRKRFLACVIEHGLATGVRTPDDFVRHFSPRVIMAAVSDAELRATLLEETLGVKRKVGVRKSQTSAGDDLQIALDEGVTTSEAIVSLFGADDRALHLDPGELWAYAIEPEPWAVGADADGFGTARDHVAYVLERALAEQLLSPRDVVDGLTLAVLVRDLPEEWLESVLAATLRQARISEPFSEDELLAVVGPATLASHVPLDEIWRSVISPFVESRHGLVAGMSSSPRTTSDASREAPSSAGAAPPALPHKQAAATKGLAVPMPAMKLAGRAPGSPPQLPSARASVAAAEPEPGKRASRPPGGRRSVPPRSR